MAKKDISSHYNELNDPFDDRKDSENWRKYALPYDTKFDIEFKKGGHLSKNKSLRQIAEMHNVSLVYINEELAKGLEVEKEHFSDFKERTRVAKDHLVENPNYYTLLSKAGLKNGGSFNYGGSVSKENEFAFNKKSDRLKSFYKTNNPSIDSLLMECQTFINELVEQQKKLVLKLSLDTNGIETPMSEFAIEQYEIGLIFKMVQSFNKYLKTTDILTDVTIKNVGLFEISATVIRDGKKYSFRTELIPAGGYNIQEFHYRYITKTDLPESKENSAIDNLKSKLSVFKKIKSLEDDINRNIKSISDLEKYIKQGYYGDDDDDKLYRVDLNKEAILYEQENIERYKKEIEKLKIKQNDLESVLISLNKLKNGGHILSHHRHSENLVKDAKSGNTPARDLNNYNDIMDLGADEAVGGDSGLAFADGGEIKDIEPYFERFNRIGLSGVDYVMKSQVSFMDFERDLDSAQRGIENKYVGYEKFPFHEFVKKYDYVTKKDFYYSNQEHKAEIDLLVEKLKKEGYTVLTKTYSFTKGASQGFNKNNKAINVFAFKLKSYANGGNVTAQRDKVYDLKLDYKIGQTFEQDKLGGKYTCRILAMDFKVTENAEVNHNSYRIHYYDGESNSEQSSHYSFLKYLKKEPNNVRINVPYSIGGTIYYESSQSDKPMKLLNSTVNGFEVLYYGQRVGWFDYYFNKNQDDSNTSVDSKDAYSSVENYMNKVLSRLTDNSPSSLKKLNAFVEPSGEKIKVLVNYSVGQKFKLPIYGGYEEAEIVGIDLGFDKDKTYPNSERSIIHYKESDGRIRDRQLRYFIEEVKAQKPNEVDVFVKAKVKDDVLILHRYMGGSKLQITQVQGYVLKLNTLGVNLEYCVSDDCYREDNVYTSVEDFKESITKTNNKIDDADLEDLLEMVQSGNYAKGGVVYDTTKPKIEKVTIKETKYDRASVIGRNASTISELQFIVRDYLGYSTKEDVDWIKFYVNDNTRGGYYINLNKGKKNTVANVNPETLNSSNFKRVIDANPYLAKNYNWTDFFEIGSQTPASTSVSANQSKYPEYYEYIGSKIESFTVGKIYKINNPNDLEAGENFIDNYGKTNGFSGSNYEKFKPSTEQAYLAQQNMISSSEREVSKVTLVYDTGTLRKIICNNGSELLNAYKLIEEQAEGDSLQVEVTLSGKDKSGQFFETQGTPQEVGQGGFEPSQIYSFEEFEEFVKSLYRAFDFNNFFSGVTVSGNFANKVLTKSDLYNSKIWIGNNLQLRDKVFEKLVDLGLVIDRKYDGDTDVVITIDDYNFYVSEVSREDYEKNKLLKEIFPSDLGIDALKAPVSNSVKPFDFSMTKIWIGNNPELSKRVQEYAFMNGFSWANGGEKKPLNTEQPCLVFSKYGNKEGFITYRRDRTNFDNVSKDHKEITEADIFGTQTPTSFPTPASTSVKPFDFSLTKIDVSNNPDLSQKVQKRAFELGWEWENGGGKTIDYDSFNYLYFTKTSISFGNTFSSFVKSPKREITEAEIFGSQTSTSSGKFTEGEIGLFKKIDKLIKDNSFAEVTLPINLWSKGADTKLFDLVDDDTLEVFSFRSYTDELGGVREDDSGNGRTVEILEKYVGWKSSRSQTPISQNNKIEPYDAYATVLIWKDNSGKEIIERTDIFYGSSGATLISQLKNIEAQSQGRDVEVVIRAFADDDKGNQFEKNDYFTIGDYGFKPSTRTNEEIKSVVEDWIDGVNFDKFFEDVIPLKGNQTPTSTSVVPKTVENTVYDLDLAISKLEKASSVVVSDYNKDVYDQSLKFLYDTRATYELALKFTPESAFMYERLDIMKKLADIEKNIKKIEDMKKGGAFYMLAKILEKLQRGENWRLMEQTQDVITNQLPQSEIDIIIRSQKFKNWFGDWEKALVNDEYDNVSKALTNGIPSVYHHGARRKKYTYREVSNGVLYLAENISYALWFSQNATAQSEEGNYLTECFVNIKNPIDLTAFHVKMIDLGDLVRYIDAIYPMAKIYDFIPAQVALLIKANQPTNVMMWAWQLIRKYAKFVNHIKENTPYDGFLYYENNPSDEVLNPITGQTEENVTKAVAIFKSPQVKVVDAVLFDGGFDDWRFENGGKIKN